MGKKFRVLRIVAFIWKIIAWVILVISVLGGCGCLMVGLMMSDQLARATREVGVNMLSGTVIGTVGGILTIVGGILIFIPIYALAETIEVMLALEENTRATAEHWKSMVQPG